MESILRFLFFWRRTLHGVVSKMKSIFNLLTLSAALNIAHIQSISLPDQVALVARSLESIPPNDSTLVTRSKKSKKNGSKHALKKSKNNGSKHALKKSKNNGSKHALKKSKKKGSKNSLKKSKKKGSKHALKKSKKKGSKHALKKSKKKGSKHALKKSKKKGSKHSRKNSHRSKKIGKNKGDHGTDDKPPVTGNQKLPVGDTPPGALADISVPPTDAVHSGAVLVANSIILLLGPLLF
jgi:hypothetical protein